VHVAASLKPIGQALFHTFFVGMATFGVLVALCGPASTSTILIFWAIGFFLVGARHACATMWSWWKRRRVIRWALQSHDAETLALSVPPAGTVTAGQSRPRDLRRVSA
jgi:hypothetical protein